MKRITICITEEQHQKIKELQLKRPGVTQSVIMRDLLDRGLHNTELLSHLQQPRDDRRIRQHVKK